MKSADAVPRIKASSRMRWGMAILALGLFGTVFWIVAVIRSSAVSVAATFGEFTAFWILFGQLAILYSGLRVLSRGHQALLRSAREHGGRLCVKCHYPLTSLPDEGDCPECGRRYRVDRVIAAWRLRDPSISAATSEGHDSTFSRSASP